jgi:hypothetical protein
MTIKGIYYFLKVCNLYCLLIQSQVSFFSCCSGEKESRRKKVGESQSSSTKTEPSGHQRANRSLKIHKYFPYCSIFVPYEFSCTLCYRLDHTVNSTKADAKPGAAAFSFKSDKRAERRKEARTHAVTLILILL